MQMSGFLFSRNLKNGSNLFPNCSRAENVITALDGANFSLESGEKKSNGSPRILNA